VAMFSFRCILWFLFTFVRLFYFFFFQAEDGIRDRNVTGVQTCALPIFFGSGGGCGVSGSSTSGDCAAGLPGMIGESDDMACPHRWGDCCPRAQGICESGRRTIPLTQTGALRYGVATRVPVDRVHLLPESPLSADGRGASVLEGRDR